MTRIPAFLLFLLSASFVYAQEQRNSLEFSPQISLATFSDGGDELSGTVIGGELIYHINTESSNRPWITGLNISSIDLILNYKNNDNLSVNGNPPGKFGDSFAMMGAVSVPLVKGQKAGLYFAPAVGLAYAGQTWFTNENEFIAGHLNFALAASLKMNSRISENLALSAGIDVFHYSNAALRVPNKGINSTNVCLGLIHYLNPRNTSGEDTDREPYFESEYKKHSFDLGVNIGRRGVYKSKDGLTKTGLYAGYNYRFNPVFGLSAGVDAIYYHSVYDANRHAETYQYYASSFKRWRAGIGLGPDVWMGRLGFSFKYGYYLYYDSLLPVNTYWTANIKYQFTKWVAIQAKTYFHQSQADFVGFGVVFTK